MSTNKHREEREWEVLAKSLFDTEAADAEPGDDTVTAEHRKEAEQIKRNVDLYWQLQQYDSASAWRKVQANLHVRTQQRRMKQTVQKQLHLRPWAAAAMILVFLGIAGYIFNQYRESHPNMIERVADKQKSEEIELPDGTRITLNTNTRMRYPEHFSGNSREISIEGEAYFEVAPDARRPFIIHAGETDIRVLGTCFNVNAYPDSETIEVIVQSGKVQVSNKAKNNSGGSHLILDPGDKAIYLCANNSLQKSTNRDPNYLAWKTHQLTFRETSLREVVRNLEKVYQVKIVMADDQLNNLLLTAHFRDYPIDFIMEVIQKTHQLNVEKRGELYVVNRN